MVNNLLYFSISRVQIAGFCTRRVIDGGRSCSFAPGVTSHRPRGNITLPTGATSDRPRGDIRLEGSATRLVPMGRNLTDLF